MKVAVSAKGNRMDAAVDPRFGRAPWFLVMDLDGEGHKWVENPNAEAAGGAGVQTASLVSQEGADTVITGNVGPSAFSVLEAAGVRIITGVSGTVQAALDDFKAGKHKESTAPTVPPHFGMGGK